MCFQSCFFVSSHFPAFLQRRRKGTKKHAPPFFFSLHPPSKLFRQLATSTHLFEPLKAVRNVKNVPSYFVFLTPEVSFWCANIESNSRLDHIRMAIRQSLYVHVHNGVAVRWMSVVSCENNCGLQRSRRDKKRVLTTYVCCEKTHSAAPLGLLSLVCMLDAPSHVILTCHSKQ